MTLPRKGNIEQVLHIFAFLSKNRNAETVFDPSDLVVDEENYELKDWTSSEVDHVQGQEELPTNIPEPCGFGFVTRAKEVPDHASDTGTRISRTRLLVWFKCYLIHLFYKKHTNVKISRFISEFVTMKQYCEYLRGTRYTLRIMGTSCDGPDYIEGDNKSILANTTVLDSNLKNKNQKFLTIFERRICL